MYMYILYSILHALHNFKITVTRTTTSLVRALVVLVITTYKLWTGYRVE